MDSTRSPAASRYAWTTGFRSSWNSAFMVRLPTAQFIGESRRRGARATSAYWLKMDDSSDRTAHHFRVSRLVVERRHDHRFFSLRSFRACQTPFAFSVADERGRAAGLIRLFLLLVIGSRDLFARAVSMAFSSVSFPYRKMRSLYRRHSLCPVVPRRAGPSKPLASALCLCSSAPFGGLRPLVTARLVRLDLNRA